jgi:hypothetical protein
VVGETEAEMEAETEEEKRETLLTRATPRLFLSKIFLSRPPRKKSETSSKTVEK